MSEPIVDALTQEIATQAQMERAEQFMEAALAVNLDEVTDDTVTVAIKEYTADPDRPGRRVATIRHATLDTFVPMKTFNKMMASRQKMVRLQKLRQQASDADGDVNEDDPSVAWMMQNVLNVWNLTESDMTLERLEEGLNFPKIQKLFTLFFGDLMSLKKSKAAPVGSTPTAPVSSQGQQ